MILLDSSDDVVRGIENDVTDRKVAVVAIKGNRVINFILKVFDGGAVGVMCWYTQCIL